MSSYLVLARKYRPRTFQEVVGQEAATSVLKGAIEEGRIAHAYLFAGPRGTGKTTLARILARCLNCERGPTSEPCGVCERCREADAGRETDVIEIDGASNRRIEDVRLLRDEVAYAPMRARYKVYIVDEVHMLTKEAFNALLKTLEEPPAHVVFLFATTEPHKVLDTILSRCQVLRLGPLTETAIAQRLDTVFEREGIEPGQGVVAELARMARGGMRDALSIADKLLALAGSRPMLEDLTRLSGEAGSRAAERLLAYVEAGDRAALLRTLSGLSGDEGELVAECLSALRSSVVLAACGEDAPFVGASAEERSIAVERARRLGPERLEAWMQELLRARERMRLMPGQESLVLELTLLDLARDETTLPISELVQRLEAVEQRVLAGGAPAPGAAAPPRSAAPRSTKAAPQPAPEPVRTVPARPVASERAEGSRAEAGLAALWAPFLSELARNHGALAAVLERRAGPSSLSAEGTGEVVIQVEGLDATEKKLVADRRNQAACSRALGRVSGRALEVRLRGVEESVRVAEPTRASGQARGDELTEQVADLFGGVIEEVE